jgi:predicted nucleic acid-binding protein
MGWCFGDQADAFTFSVLDRIRNTEASVPSVWPLEVANGLLVGERRNKLTKADTSKFLELLNELPIAVDEESPRRALGPILTLAREQALSSYDAAYLELAMRQGLGLATRDKAMKRAAFNLGVTLVEK